MLIAPAISMLVWYILFYYYWLWLIWPILILGFGWRVALYEVHVDGNGQPSTGRYVPMSGAWRSNACAHTPSTFPSTVYFKMSAAAYETNLHNDPATGEVVDVLDAKVLLPRIREDWPDIATLVRRALRYFKSS